MSFEVKGTVHAVLPKEGGIGKQSGQPWSRQTVVIKWESGNGQYQRTNYLALTNAKRAEEFGRLRVGDVITAKVEVTSREYNGKWYHDVNCFSWTLEGSDVAAAPAYSAPVSQPAAPADAQAEGLEPNSSDLPF